MIEDLNTIGLPEDGGQPSRTAQRRAQFQQANESLALEGMRVDQTDLAIQDKVSRGELTPDQAVEFYLQRANKGAT